MNTSSSNSLPVSVIACRVFHGLLERYLPQELADSIIYLEYGLHRVPKRIASTLQEHLDTLDKPSLVVVGYGMCGSGLIGLKSGRHTLLIPCVDDCIAMLLGSHRAYIREFEAVPGTYYLSKGWLESGTHPLREYEECVEKYGEENAQWIMDQQYQNYRRVALVAHSQEDLDQYRSQAQGVGKFCRRWDMRFEEILGSDRYVKRLVEVALNPATIDEDFILIPPGGQVCLEQFLR